MQPGVQSDFLEKVETVGEEGPPGVNSQQSGDHRDRRATWEDKTQEPRGDTPLLTQYPPKSWFSPPPQTGTVYPSMVRGNGEEMTLQPVARDKCGSALRAPRGSSFPGLGLNTHKGRSPHPAACP